MNEKRCIHAVDMMRAIRDRVSKSEEGLTWKERVAKLHRDLRDNRLWKRLRARTPSSVPADGASHR